MLVVVVIVVGWFLPPIFAVFTSAAVVSAMMYLCHRLLAAVARVGVPGRLLHSDRRFCSFVCAPLYMQRPACSTILSLYRVVLREREREREREARKKREKGEGFLRSLFLLFTSLRHKIRPLAGYYHNLAFSSEFLPISPGLQFSHPKSPTTAGN